MAAQSGEVPPAGTRGRRGGASGKRAQRAAKAAEAIRLADEEGSVAPTSTSASRYGESDDEKAGSVSGEKDAAAECAMSWAEFCASNAKVEGASLQLRHFLGNLNGLSVGQVETLQEVMRRLCLELEECRVRLARMQEREQVLARVALELERHGTLARTAEDLTWRAAGGASRGDCAAAQAAGALGAEPPRGEAIVPAVVRREGAPTSATLARHLAECAAKMEPRCSGGASSC
jgi:hypothetical protein